MKQMMNSQLVNVSDIGCGCFRMSREAGWLLRGMITISQALHCDGLAVNELVSRELRDNPVFTPSTSQLQLSREKQQHYASAMAKNRITLHKAARSS